MSNGRADPIAYNEQLFATIQKRLASDNEKTFVAHAHKLRDWLSSTKAYYELARPRIVEMLETGKTTLDRLNGGHSLLNSTAFDSSLITRKEAFVQLVEVALGKLTYFREVDLQNRLKAIGVSLGCSIAGTADNQPTGANRALSSSDQPSIHPSSSGTRGDPALVRVKVEPDDLTLFITPQNVPPVPGSRHRRSSFSKSFAIPSAQYSSGKGNGSSVTAFTSLGTPDDPIVIGEDPEPPVMSPTPALPVPRPVRKSLLEPATTSTNAVAPKTMADVPTVPGRSALQTMGRGGGRSTTQPHPVHEIQAATGIASSVQLAKPSTPSRKKPTPAAALALGIIASTVTPVPMRRAPVMTAAPMPNALDTPAEDILPSVGVLTDPTISFTNPVPIQPNSNGQFNPTTVSKLSDTQMLMAPSTSSLVSQSGQRFHTELGSLFFPAAPHPPVPSSGTQPTIPTTPGPSRPLSYSHNTSAFTPNGMQVTADPKPPVIAAPGKREKTKKKPSLVPSIGAMNKGMPWADADLKWYRDKKGGEKDSTVGDGAVMAGDVLPVRQQSGTIEAAARSNAIPSLGEKAMSMEATQTSFLLGNVSNMDTSHAHSPVNGASSSNLNAPMQNKARLNDGVNSSEAKMPTVETTPLRSESTIQSVAPSTPNQAVVIATPTRTTSSPAPSVATNSTVNLKPPLVHEVEAGNLVVLDVPPSRAAPRVEQPGALEHVLIDLTASPVAKKFDLTGLKFRSLTSKPNGQPRLDPHLIDLTFSPPDEPMDIDVPPTAASTQGKVQVDVVHVRAPAQIDLTISASNTPMQSNNHLPFVTSVQEQSTLSALALETRPVVATAVPNGPSDGEHADLLQPSGSHQVRAELAASREPPPVIILKERQETTPISEADTSISGRPDPSAIVRTEPDALHPREAPAVIELEVLSVGGLNGIPPKASVFGPEGLILSPDLFPHELEPGELLPAQSIQSDAVKPGEVTFVPSKQTDILRLSTREPGEISMGDEAANAISPHVEVLGDESSVTGVLRTESDGIDVREGQSKSASATSSHASDGSATISAPASESRADKPPINTNLDGLPRSSQAATFSDLTDQFMTRSLDVNVTTLEEPRSEDIAQTKVFGPSPITDSRIIDLNEGNNPSGALEPQLQASSSEFSHPFSSAYTVKADKVPAGQKSSAAQTQQHDQTESTNQPQPSLPERRLSYSELTSLLEPRFSSDAKAQKRSLSPSTIDEDKRPANRRRTTDHSLAHHSNAIIESGLSGLDESPGSEAILISTHMTSPASSRQPTQEPQMHSYFDANSTAFVCSVVGGGPRQPVEMEFVVSQEQGNHLAKWQNRELHHKDVSRSVCLSLACYDTDNLDLNNIQAEELFSSPAMWPNGGSLFATINSNNKQSRICLSPPFETIRDCNFVDISKWVQVGEPTIHFDFRVDMTHCLFVLWAHPPTSMQLRTMTDRDLPFREFLRDIEKLDFSFPCLDQLQ